MGPTSIFGTIAPPPGSPTDLGATIGKFINLFLIVAALFTLAYMLWGAFDWIVSGGEKEKIDKARNKITNAALGLILVVVVLALFNTIVGPILNISPGTAGWQFKLPTLQSSSCSCQGGTCSGSCTNKGTDCFADPNICY